MSKQNIGFMFHTPENAEAFKACIILSGFVRYAAIPSPFANVDWRHWRFGAHSVEVETYSATQVRKMARAAEGYIGWYKK